MELRIGDLIQCRDNHYNRGLGIVNRIGMVAELRKRDVRLLFDVDHQAVWLSKRGVNRITLPPTAAPTLLDRLNWLIGFSGAEECELERNELGSCVFTMACGGADLAGLEKMREYMKPLFVSLRVLPRGMSRLALEIVFERGEPTT